MEIKDGGITTTLPDSTPVLSYNDWLKEGKRRFGDDFGQWKFICPICGNIAAVNDYKPFKDKGASPDSAVQECIGRYTESPFRAFGSSTAERGKPCDYAIYGLFRFPGMIVEMSDGAKKMAFAFAPAEK